MSFNYYGSGGMIILERLNMTKKHPFDDFHQRIHWNGSSIGTVTQQWGILRRGTDGE